MSLIKIWMEKYFDFYTRYAIYKQPEDPFYSSLKKTLLFYAFHIIFYKYLHITTTT